jgi:hypothetical protein
MRKIFLTITVLAGLLAIGGPTACAQEPNPPRLQVSSADLALTYTLQHASVIPGDSKFWMQGASLDGGITFYHGFGLALDLSGGYCPRIAPGVSLGELTYTIGPRYTYIVHSKLQHQVSIFGQALAGAVKGLDSVFPEPTGVSGSASAFAWQAGGGLDFAITKHFAIRAGADYLRTYLPNNASNNQANLRLAIGVSYHIRRH